MTASSRSLLGRVALVTGAGRGIGEGIAKRLARQGARVVVADIDGERASAVASHLGGDAESLTCDLSVRAEAAGVVERTVELVGELDILVNNAGIIRDRTLHRMSEDEWDSVLAVNLTAVFLTMRAALPRMRERGYGRIVNISSVNWMGAVGQANYSASKAGVIGVSLAAALENAGKGITVNVVCPGFIDTDMTRSMPSDVFDRVLASVPMGRAGTPDDVAAVVAFLASDEAAYVTGEIVNVRGGMR